MSVETYRARRRLTLPGPVVREPGQLVPEAHLWLRPEAWVFHGRMERVTVSDGEFRSAIAEFCPGLGKQLRRLIPRAPRKATAKRAAKKPAKRASTKKSRRATCRPAAAVPVAIEGA